MDSPSDDNRKWYAVQTRSNMEKKAVESLKRQIDIEDMGEYISKDDILLPTETVSEIKNGKKRVNTRNLYPGYIFVRVKLYDDDDNFLEKPWYFVRGINGIINFMGGERPGRPQKGRNRKNLRTNQPVQGHRKAESEL